jgi:hypothetical protein
VGKTRLAREAIARAEREGATTSWVVASRANASIPFGPFAHLLPESLPPATSRLELLSRIAEELSSRTRGGRLVIGIDDAHLLDEASAVLVHQLASSRGFFVLATTRSGEAAPDSVTALWKDGLAERLEVKALSEGVVGELVSQVLGGQVHGPTLARLWEASGGNVLFLRELLLAGQETNALRLGDGVWSWSGPMVVSPRLQEILDARLGALEPDQVALMEVLAYAEPASVSFLETLFSSPTLEAAERQGWWWWRRTAGGWPSVWPIPSTGNRCVPAVPSFEHATSSVRSPQPWRRPGRAGETTCFGWQRPAWKQGAAGLRNSSWREPAEPSPPRIWDLPSVWPGQPSTPEEVSPPPTCSHSHSSGKEKTVGTLLPAFSSTSTRQTWH